MPDIYQSSPQANSSSQTETIWINNANELLQHLINLGFLESLADFDVKFLTKLHRQLKDEEIEYLSLNKQAEINPVIKTGIFAKLLKELVNKDGFINQVVSWKKSDAQDFNPSEFKQKVTADLQSLAEAWDENQQVFAFLQTYLVGLKNALSQLISEQDTQEETGYDRQLWALIEEKKPEIEKQRDAVRDKIDRKITTDEAYGGQSELEAGLEKYQQLLAASDQELSEENIKLEVEEKRKQLSELLNKYQQDVGREWRNLAEQLSKNEHQLIGDLSEKFPKLTSGLDDFAPVFLKHLAQPLSEATENDTLLELVFKLTENFREGGEDDPTKPFEQLVQEINRLIGQLQTEIQNTQNSLAKPHLQTWQAKINELLGLPTETTEDDLGGGEAADQEEPETEAEPDQKPEDQEKTEPEDTSPDKTKETPTVPTKTTKLESAVPTGPASPIGKAKNINEVSEAQFKLIESVKLSLREELLAIAKQQKIWQRGGLNSFLIDEYIDNYLGNISNQVWQRILEYGVLETELSGEIVRRVWRDTVDDYLRRILVDIAYELHGDQAAQVLEHWLASHQPSELANILPDLEEFGEVDADDLAASLQKNNLVQALQDINELTSVANANFILELRDQYYQQNPVPGIEAARESDQLEINFLLELLASLQNPNITPEEITKILNQIYGWLLDQEGPYKAWKNVFFTDDRLKAAFVYLPELITARFHLKQVQSQWRLSLQAIKGSSKATEKEANKYVQVGKAFIAIDLGDKTDVIPVATDQLSRQEAAAQLEMALNLVYWSELSFERQREVETAIYLYHFSNQEIPPQVALQFLFAAEVLDNDQLSLADASQLGQLNEYLSGTEDLTDYLSPSYVNQAVKAQSQANQARQNSLTAQQAKAAATLRLAKIGAMAASGNYVSAIKALATDKEARKQLVEILKKTAAVQGFMMLLQLLPWLILLQFAKEIWAALKAAWDGTVGWAWRQVKSLGNSIKELVTGEPATQASALAADISKEAAAAAEGATIPAKNLTEGLKNLGANTVEAVSSNISLASTVIATSGTAKSIAVVAGAAITVPMLLAATLTIIVITVIGGSLNDLPAGFALKGILQHSYFGQGCWPTSGTISATPEGYPDGSEHLTSDGGTAFDIATINIGKPVYATFDGTARYIISAEGYGLHVKLTTAFGTELIFGHLSSSTITTESNGQRVQAGELIGLSGSTGKSTGPHLHYESTKAAVHIRSLVPSDPYPTFNVYVSHTDCLDIKPSNFSATESGGNNTLDEQTPAVVDGNEDEGNGDNN